ncbi:MAG: inositol-3-phosphate synthase [Planctomycetes bacterium]|nr:inositol-3-phosphate synthase [Planctomycetota bacterium]
MGNKSLGVWIIGASGSVASAAVAGAEIFARQLAEPIGLITELPDFKNVGFTPFDRIIFGGHEVRKGNARESFERLAEEAHIGRRVVESIGAYFETLQKNTRLGITVGCGKGVSEAVGETSKLDALSLAEIVGQLSRDITEFKESNNLERVIVLNLASTEPPAMTGIHTESIDGFEEMLKTNHKEIARASSLYAYVAFKCNCPYINFTPSVGSDIPALFQLAKQQAIPHAGRDGKTGETLIKAVLAGMFKYRALKILSWQGYNILGNMDGKVLADPESLKSKLSAKDTVLPQALGYKPHTHTGIDYVPSLGEWKVAWDFIHFEGFLGTKMSMQFIWQGCDSMLAAPLVIDLIRLVDLAHRRKESGILSHLGLFFKQPLGTDVSDLHQQWHLLEEYLSKTKKER